ncbi:somatostatin receptor type 5-like [Patiria miniata]|uniref:G-protein coupled receptors family 1 profile domain-containing protein n=1 Tax=Patiria miniata TaxID=46514 RepID=A0A913ZF73_PATMI|nr:somatostatin receptor type 5-like [Patiria miniata]
MEHFDSYDFHYGELLPNLTEGECAYMPFVNVTEENIGDFVYTTTQKVILLAILPVFMVVGLLDNLAFVYVVLKIPDMKTVTNAYLLNLAIADVLYLTFSVGEKLVKYGLSSVSDNDGVLGLGGCIVVYIITDLAYFAGLFFVTLVSIDRFMAVHSPMASGRKGGSDITQMTILGTWILAAVLSALMSPAYGALEEYCILWPDVAPYNNWAHVAAECVAISPWLTPFTQGLQTLPFFISFITNVILYICIIKGLDQSIERLRKHGLMKEKDINVRNQIARMLVVNGMVFFFCLAPFELMSLLSMVDTLSGGHKIVIPLETRFTLDHIGRVLAYFNSAINPLIYTAMSSRYRQAFKQAFFPKNRRGFFRGVRTSFNHTLSHTTETHVDETQTESRF